MPGHSRHSFGVTLNIRHRLITTATKKRPRVNEANQVRFPPLWVLIFYLSRLQSFTDPSAAHEARLMSDGSREIPASGRKTTAPTLVLCPAAEQEEDEAGHQVTHKTLRLWWETPTSECANQVAVRDGPQLTQTAPAGRRKRECVVQPVFKLATSTPAL